MIRIFIALTILCFHARVAAAPAGHNADSVPAPRSVALGEVSVTAIKGGNHPNADEAVTYIGSRTVADYDLVNMRQASALAPNFYMPAYGSRMTSSVYVRGLGTRIDQPAVGLNIDNIPIINKDNYDFDLADIDRVEILRGPQNILYGRNTMAGLMNIYTVSPLSFQGVKARVSYGSRDSYRVSAGFYGKIKPTLGMSVTGEVSGIDGWHHNSYNGSASVSARYAGRRHSAPPRTLWWKMWRWPHAHVRAVIPMRISPKAGSPITTHATTADGRLSTVSR